MKRLRIVAAALLQLFALTTLIVAFTAHVNLFVRLIVALLAATIFATGITMARKPQFFMWLVMVVPLP